MCFFGVTGVTGVTVLIYRDIFRVSDVIYGVTGYTFTPELLSNGIQARQKPAREGSFLHDQQRRFFVGNWLILCKGQVF